MNSCRLFDFFFSQIQFDNFLAFFRVSLNALLVFDRLLSLRCFFEDGTINTSSDNELTQNLLGDRCLQLGSIYPDGPTSASWSAFLNSRSSAYD